jgi:hypothetical protein
MRRVGREARCVEGVEGELKTVLVSDGRHDMDWSSSWTYRVDTCCAIFFWQTSNLKCDLHKRPRYRSRQNYTAQCVVNEGFEMSFSRALDSVSVGRDLPSRSNTYFQRP